MAADALCLPILAAPPPVARPDGYLFAPWLRILPRENRDITALLPIADVNGAILRALASAPPPEGAVAALMLSDPFLRVRDVLGTFARSGISAVSNFPTPQLIDGEAARALDGSGLGVARERAMLDAFRAQGIAGIAFARGLPNALAILAAQPAKLVLHPGVALADWRPRAVAAAALLKTMTALRAETGIPILVYRPRGYGAELDAAVAAADGSAWVEDMQP